MMTLTALLGGDIKGLPERIKKKFVLTWLRSLQVWPIYDTVLYAYVPASHRPLFNTFMSILWGGYLSHISQAEGDPKPSPVAAGHDHAHDHHHHVHGHHGHDHGHDMPDVPFPTDGESNEFWEEVEGVNEGDYEDEGEVCEGEECEAFDDEFDEADLDYESDVEEHEPEEAVAA